MDKYKIFADNVEQAALNQIEKLINNSIYRNSTFRFMPDVHAGKDCTIGTTINCSNSEDLKIDPRILGNDLGCGVSVIKLNISKDELDLKAIDTFIKNSFSPLSTNKYVFNDILCTNLNLLKCKDTINVVKCAESIGTLGNGNHFISIDINPKDNTCVYLIVHTGSRKLGSEIYKHYISIAEQIGNPYLNIKDTLESLDNLIRKFIIDNLKDTNSRTEINSLLCKYNSEISKEIKELFYIKKLEDIYLNNNHVQDYIKDVEIATNIASLNRNLISNEIISFISKSLNKEIQTSLVVDSAHNYINVMNDNIIIRKGAISAKLGEPVIIPINMRDGCIIGHGLGNLDWNYSAPHGAGRIMSRRQAFKDINLNDYKQSMKNVYSSSVNLLTIDEAPMVYKDINYILEQIKPTVEIDFISKPIYNFKNSDIKHI